MFTALFFRIPPKLETTQCWPREWINRLWNKYNEKLHSNKENKLLRPPKTWRNLRGTMLNEGSHAQNSTYFRIPFMWNSRVIIVAVFGEVLNRKGQDGSFWNEAMFYVLFCMVTTWLNTHVQVHLPVHFKSLFSALSKLYFNYAHAKPLPSWDFMKQISTALKTYGSRALKPTALGFVQ